MQSPPNKTISDTMTSGRDLVLGSGFLWRLGVQVAAVVVGTQA
jgi:hypothetical protein